MATRARLPCPTPGSILEAVASLSALSLGARAHLRGRATSAARLARPLTASLVYLTPALAWARALDGMDGMVRAAIATAVVAIGGLSLAASLAALALVFVYRRRPSLGSQTLAVVCLLLNLVGHGYGAFVMDEYALVLIPGAGIIAVAGLLYGRTAPPTGDDGRPLHGARWAALLVAAILGAGAMAKRSASTRAEEHDAELSRRFQETLALAHDPNADKSAREQAILRLQSSGSCNLDGLDLSGFVLPALQLDRCSVLDTNLSGADLTGAQAGMANLSRTSLRGATMAEAYLDYAHLRGVDLRDVDLRNASVSRTDLRDADLRGADLRGADLSRSDLGGATISAAQLTSAKSLYKIEGLSPELAALFETPEPESTGP